MKINRLIPIMLLLIITLMGCKKDGNAGDGLSKDEMNFTAGSSPNTKTVYDKNNPWQINWIEGDQITVFCEQAGNKKQAAYDVTPIAATPHKGTITLALSESPDGTKERRTGLRWRTGKHNVYSVYPSLGQSGGNITKQGEGKFTFNFPQTQYCSKGGVTLINGNYMLRPNMYLAYMVAKNEGLDPLSFVELLFKPIATTLEITVRGAAQTGTAELSSLELKVKNLIGQYVKKSGTNYQVQFDAKQQYTTPTTAISDALTPYTSGAVATADFSIKVTGGTTFQLKPKESVTFTVFLPPIKNLDDVEVKCMGSGNIELGKKQILTTVQYARPASKRRITLPNVVLGPDSIKVLPADDINLATRPYTSGDIVLKYGLTQQLKAIAYYPNGTTKVITSDAGTTWSSNLTSISSVGNTTSDKGLVTLIMNGTSQITASYTENGVTKSGTANIKPQVYRTFKATDYYMWDAHLPCDIINNPDGTTPPWGPTSSSYNNAVNSEAEASCKDAPSRYDIKRYLANRAFMSKTDGLIYILEPDNTGGKLYCDGLWMTKWANLSSGAIIDDDVTKVLLENNRPLDSEIDKCFFLPICGYFSKEKFDTYRVTGGYWLSSPFFSTYSTSYILSFDFYLNKGEAFPRKYSERYISYVPLVGFDDTYVHTPPPTLDSIDVTPKSKTIQAGETLQMKAMAYYSDGTVKDITTSVGTLWRTYNYSNRIASVSNKSGEKGKVTGIGDGIENIVAEYRLGGFGPIFKTGYATLIVENRLTADNYYMWDAPVGQPYSTTNGGTNHNYNTTNDEASRSCKDAPTLEQLKMYLGAGVYWVTDGPPYKSPDGNTYSTGLMLKKAANIPNFYLGTAQKATSVTTTNGISYEFLKDEYFFLPACGNYGSGSFGSAGTNGYYWSSTPNATLTLNAYSLIFNSGNANVYLYYTRNNGFVPMVGFDPTYTK